MKAEGGEVSETIEEICESLRHSLDDETCEWYECRTDDERQWLSDLAARIEVAYNREVAELLDVIDDLIELAECGVYSCCGQCTRRGCPGEEHCCETKDGVKTLQRARKMLAKAKGKEKDKK